MVRGGCVFVSDRGSSLGWSRGAVRLGGVVRLLSRRETGEPVESTCPSPTDPAVVTTSFQREALMVSDLSCTKQISGKIWASSTPVSSSWVAPFCDGNWSLPAVIPEV
jgi:hypothetical protein